MINFGLIGTGRISEWVMKGALQDSRIRIAAICSRTFEAAQAFIARHPEIAEAKIYTSVEQLANDPEIDAVYIGTPNQTHYDYTLTCLNAGKNVLCEKPLAVTAREAREMADTARKRKLLLMEAMISTLNPNFQAVSKRIKDIAPIINYSSHFCQYSSKYDALKNGVIASSFQSGTAGALRDIGVYTLYPLITLFGKPNNVISDMKIHSTAEGPTDIHGNLMLKFSDMQATLTYSKICDSYTATEISGENGNLILDEIHIAHKAEFIPHNSPTSGQGPKPARHIVSEGLLYNEYYYEFKEFADLIEAGLTESSTNSLDVSVIVIEIIETALKQNGLD